MQASRPRRRGASRSPTRASAGSRRPAPSRAFLRRLQPPGESRLSSLRRRIAFLALAAALLAATPAGAQLVPIDRHGLPLLRAGVIHVPRGHARGRVRVIVTLKLPPLAAAFARSPAAFAGRRLNVASVTSRAYLARVEAAQRAAVTRLQRAIPEATISRRF